MKRFISLFEAAGISTVQMRESGVLIYDNNEAIELTVDLKQDSRKAGIGGFCLKVQSLIYANQYGADLARVSFSIHNNLLLEGCPATSDVMLYPRGMLLINFETNFGGVAEVGWYADQLRDDFGDVMQRASCDMTEKGEGFRIRRMSADSAWKLIRAAVKRAVKITRDQVDEQTVPLLTKPRVKTRAQYQLTEPLKVQ